jgi:hypothetical protein
MVVHWLKLRPDRVRATVEAEQAYRLALKGEHIDELAYERRHRTTVRIGQIGSTLAMAGALCYIAIAQSD